MVHNQKVLVAVLALAFFLEVIIGATVLGSCYSEDGNPDVGTCQPSTTGVRSITGNTYIKLSGVSFTGSQSVALSFMAKITSITSDPSHKGHVFVFGYEHQGPYFDNNMYRASSCFDTNWHYYKTEVTSTGYTIHCDGNIIYTSSHRSIANLEQVTYLTFGCHFSQKHSSYYYRVTGSIKNIIVYEAPTAPLVWAFNYTGADQVWAVPDNVDRVYISMWGAGGSGVGGAGGFVTGILNVSNVTSLTIMVGEGGNSTREKVGRLRTYGGGGCACRSSRGIKGYKCGGGRSAIRINGEDSVTAGGGGGGSSAGGGNGGDKQGGDSTYLGQGYGPHNPPGSPAQWGHGGTQTAGGEGGQQGWAGHRDGVNGAKYLGGGQPSNCGSNLHVGAGGGGGWFGGGQGGAAAYYGGGGGGGSSFIANLQNGTTLPGESGSFGLVAKAGGTQSLHYRVGIGIGGGGNGLVVLSTSLAICFGNITVGNQTCVPMRQCLPGWYVFRRGKLTADRACRACEPGTFSSTTNSDACLICGKDSFQPEHGQAHCLPCPAGHHTIVATTRNPTDHDNDYDCVPSTFQISVFPRILEGGKNCSIEIQDSPGNIFPSNHTATKLTLGKRKLVTFYGSLSSNRRRFSGIQVPTSGICSAPGCELWTRLVSYDTLYNASGSVDVYYIKKACPSDDTCLIVPLRFQSYPRERCQARERTTGECMACPIGARCPGGQALWALPRFAGAMGSNGLKMIMCKDPSARCLGYVEAYKQEKCARGYGGPLCGGCKKGFYTLSSGPQACYPCPNIEDQSSSIFLTVLVPFLYLMAVFSTLAGLALLVSVVAVKRNGGTVRGSLRRTADFLLYMFFSLSTLAQVSRKCSGNLPEYLQVVATHLAWFQFDFVGPAPPSCTEHPFWRHNVIFAASCLCVLLSVNVLSNGCGVFNEWSYYKSKYFKVAAHGATVWLCLSYALSTNLSLDTVHCIKDMTHTERSGTVLASNPVVPCFEGDHRATFGLAIASLLLHGLLFPLFSAWSIFSAQTRDRGVAMHTLRLNPAFYQDHVWKYFLASSYTPKRFYFRHLELALLLFGGLCNEIFYPYSVPLYAIVYCALLSFVAALYLAKRPFLPADMWKLPVRVQLIVCSIFHVIIVLVSSQPEKGLQDKNGALAWLAPLGFTLNLSVFLTLFVAYGRVLFEGARKEEKKKQTIRTRAKSNVSWYRNPSYIETETEGVEMVGIDQGDDLDTDVYVEAVEWFKHFDTQSQTAYFECIRTITSWEQDVSSNKYDAIECHAHSSENTGELYYRIKQRRVTWNKPEGVNESDILIGTPEACSYESSGESANLDEGADLDGSDQDKPEAPECSLAMARRQLKAVNKVEHVKMKVKSAGAWWELTDENGVTCYLNVETNEVIYNLPKGWVKSMAKSRFNTNKN